MYDPTIGEWLSEDPIGFDSGTYNLYEYVSNDPLNRTDPTGLAEEDAERYWRSGSNYSLDIYSGETQGSRLREFGSLSGSQRSRIHEIAVQVDQLLHEYYRLKELRGDPSLFRSVFFLEDPISVYDEYWNVTRDINELQQDYIYEGFNNVLFSKNRVSGGEILGIESGTGLLAAIEYFQGSGSGAVGEFAVVVPAASIAQAGLSAGMRGAAASTIATTVGRTAAFEAVQGLVPIPLIAPSNIRGLVPQKGDAAELLSEYRHFRAQGFTPKQARYLTEPYPATAQGHHFPISQKTARDWGLPDGIKDSQFNVLRPNGISRGRFYELHYMVDRSFHNANFPPRIGGQWTGGRLGLQRYEGLVRIWHATPGSLKAIGAAGTVGTGSAVGYYIFFESDDN
ncbi:MAG: RHS repeat-associated core domain-containing protein [Pirellulales bacterium]